MVKPVDMTGMRYGRVVALARVDSRNARSFWKFRCDCGAEKEIDAAHVRYGRIRSCGCLLDDVLHSKEHAVRCEIAAKMPRSHGMSNTPVHAVWKAMIQRCTNASSPDYRWYGALGVKVCGRWRSFENFFADMGEPNGLTIDRIDPRGDYEPANCRWADWATQRANKRNSNAKHHASA